MLVDAKVAGVVRPFHIGRDDPCFQGLQRRRIPQRTVSTNASNHAGYKTAFSD
jgi:hypothetical protein